LSLDLFGSEVSTNAANAYAAGPKGRFYEERIQDDHRLVDDTYPVLKLVDKRTAVVLAPALVSLNMRLRDDYVRDCEAGIARWNRIIAATGVDFRLRLPHLAFNCTIGEFAQVQASPDGEMLTTEEWTRRCRDWLPSPADGEYVQSLMRMEPTPDAYACWIAPPKRGSDNQPGDFEYVRLEA